MSKLGSTIAFGAAAVLITIAAQASDISLGEIERQSALGQPLALLIPVSADADALEGAVVRVAANAAYQRAGFVKAALLENARAQIVARQGKLYVQVETADLVREPILDLLIEVVSHGGSAQRHYALLIDPPGAVSRGASATAATSAGIAVISSAAQAPAAPTPLPQKPADLAPPATVQPAQVVMQTTGAASEVLRAVPAARTTLTQQARTTSPGLANRFNLWPVLIALLGLSGVVAYRLRKPAPEREARPEVERPAPVLAPRSAYVPLSRRTAEPIETLPERNPEQNPDFYNDVAKLLLSALEHDPARSDLRHKLLEIYSASGAKEEFRKQTRYYLEQLQGRADQYWHSIVNMGRDLLPESSLYTDTPQLLARTVVQTLPLMAAQAPTFQRFHEAINQAKLSARQAELERAWDSLPREPSFQKAFSDLLSRCVKRPTALLQAERLGADFGGASVYRKYEDERGSGDVAAINALGQVLLASRMGKKRVVAGSVSGTHGVAVANAATQLGLDCTIYMMHGDQGKNPEAVRRMHELGATVITVHSSMAAPSDDVRIRALDDWMQDGESTLYINSVDAGPYPYPSIVLHFQSAVGREARAQMLEATGGLPDAVITSTGDGLSAIGLLQSFLSDSSVALYCVEAGAGDAKQSGHHFRREHSWLRASGRVSYISVDSAEAVQAVVDAARLQDWSLDAGGGEVLAQAHRVAGELGAGKKLLVMLPRPQSNQAGALPLRAAS